MGARAKIPEPIAVAEAWSWRWTGWASWPVTPGALGVAAVAVGLDVFSAWAGEPEWYLGRVLVSPALPLAAALVAIVGTRRLGLGRRGLAVWREFLLVTGAGIVVASIAHAQATPNTSEVNGVLLTGIGEEVVYRLGAVLLVGAACARLVGRNWRDTSAWGTGPAVAALVGAGVIFTALPGHVGQMTDAASVVPFASLAVLLGYVALRTGSLLPGIAVHVLLDLTALAYFAGSIGGSTRFAIAGALLVALTLGLMPAGRRLGLRRRVPSVIDLRDVATKPIAPSVPLRAEV